MVSRKLSKVQSLESTIAKVQSQRADLAARLVELESGLGKLDTDNVANEVTRLSRDSAELSTGSRVLDQLDRKVDEFLDALARARAEDTQAKVEKLWPKEERLIRQISDAVTVLDEALGDLAGVQLEIHHLGGFCKANVPRLLAEAIPHTLDAWRYIGLTQGGGTLNKEHAAQVERWNRGEREPLNPAFLELMENRDARRAYERKTGLKVRGHGANLTQEFDPRRMATPGDSDGPVWSDDPARLANA